MIPRSVIVGAVRGAVTERTDDRIEQLADIIHGGMVWAMERDARLEEVDRRLEAQHAEIVHAVDSMKAGFASMDKRFDGLVREMSGRFEAMDERFVSMDKRFESMDKRFESMDKRFDSLIREMSVRFEAVDKRFEAVDMRFDDLIREMNARFETVDKRFSTLTWLIGVAFVVINATMVMLKIF
ncbi:MAG TPA: hypothetical protein ENN21_09380 [Spirochaetes bacterium]|nr:hypothetical protein [Spirochaetota bacterium]